MFSDRNLLRKELAKTIGFYQNANDEYSDLSPSLILSTERRYVNEVHGLITNENIDQSFTNFSRYPYDTWSVAVVYEFGDVVQLDGSIFEYVNTTASTANVTTNTTYWFELDSINQYLHQNRLMSVDHVLDSIFNDRKIKNTVKSIYENLTLFSGNANYRSTETNQDKFVGLRFRLKHDRSLISIINRIGHQFSEVVASLPLYLYHSSQQTPLATFTINHTVANSSKWTALTENNILRYISEDYDAGGDFYLGYSQSDLSTAVALNKHQLDWTNGYSCRSCTPENYDNWVQWSKYINVIAFSINESEFTAGVDLFDPAKLSFHSNKNFGLNIEMTNQCDLTPFFLQEKSRLAESIMTVCGHNILKDMASNTRGTSNRANQVKDEARREMYSYKDSFGTITDKVAKSLKGLSFDFSELNDDCLSCNEPSGGDADHTFRFKGI